jgi:hypothetical protein
MSEDTTTETVTPAALAAPTPETFSLDYVQGLRQEAAKYRTEKNEAVERIKTDLQGQFEAQLAAKDSEFGELQSELSARQVELVKLKAILAAGIPSEDVMTVAELVQGDDETTVSESVERVKSLIGKAPARDRPVDPSQGSGNSIPLNGDPLLESLKKIVGVR